MSRRSPERDSGRQDYGGGPSSHVPRTQTIQDDYEPGQVEGTWRWEDEGDVRVPPSVDLGHAGPFTSERITGGRAYVDRDQVVAVALEVFSRTMHATLLSTSTRALAAQHLRRMESFPIPPSGIPDPLLAEAQNRSRAAEADLGERMRELHWSFNDLMMRTLVSQRPIRSERHDSRDLERDTEQNRNTDKDFSKAELDAIRDRMRALEHRLEQINPISRKGKEKESSGTEPENGVENKRSRAKLLLNEMLSRLAVVEGLKEDLDTRCNDLEDLVNSRMQDELEIVRLGNGRWKVMEDLRDPDGVIRGLKRKRDTSPPKDVPLSPQFPGEETKSTSYTNHDSTEPAIAAPQAQMTNDRSEITLLKAQVESLKTIVKSHPILNGARQGDPDVGLQRQLEALQNELRELKEDQKRLMDRASADTKTLDDLKLHCETFVKAQILNTVAKLSKNPPSIGLDSNPTISHPNGSASKSSSINPSAFSPNTQQHQQQQQRQPHQGGHLGASRGVQRPTLSPQIIAQANSVRPFQPAKSSTIGQPQFDSFAQVHPQRTAQGPALPPSKQIGREATTAPTVLSETLTVQKASRPGSALGSLPVDHQPRTSTLIQPEPQQPIPPHQQQRVLKSDQSPAPQSGRPPPPARYEYESTGRMGGSALTNFIASSTAPTNAATTNLVPIKPTAPTTWYNSSASIFQPAQFTYAWPAPTSLGPTHI